MADGRTVWRISAIIEASEEDARAAEEAIARALCPDENHTGYCPVPWTTLACRFDDLDDGDRVEWEAEFAQTRQRAREPGEPGA